MVSLIRFLFYMWVETGIADECETSTNIICCQSFATWYVLEGDNKFLTILQMKQHQSDCKEKKSGKITVDVDICSTQSYVKCILLTPNTHTDSYIETKKGSHQEAIHHRFREVM